MCRLKGGVFPLVLIYPYWNVNMYAADSVPVIYQVLIYPYWNVNLCLNIYAHYKKPVLIYPYWNVNLCNRQIVLCTSWF